MTNSQIFNTVVEFFEEDNWNFHWLEGMSVLSIPFTGKNGRWMCYAQAREEQQQFVYYSVSPVNVPPERQPAIAEFITRANYGMIIGNFEMDYDDGEVRYKTSIDVEGDELTPALIKQLVYANVIIMDRYLPGLMAVIYGNASPASEVEKIEGTRKKTSGVKSRDDGPFPGDTLNEQVRSRIEDILRNIDENQASEPGDDETDQDEDDFEALMDELDFEDDEDDEGFDLNNANYTRGEDDEDDPLPPPLADDDEIL